MIRPGRGAPSAPPLCSLGAMNTPGRRRSALVALVAQAALIIAACGGGSDSNGGGTTAAQQTAGRRAGQAGEDRRLRPARLRDSAAGERRPLRRRAGGKRTDRQGRQGGLEAGPRHHRPGHLRRHGAGPPLDRLRPGLPELARSSTPTSPGTTRTNTSSVSRSRTTARSMRAASARCCTWTTSPPTTTVACCCSGPTGSSTSARATAGPARIRAQWPEPRFTAGQDPPDRPTANINGGHKHRRRTTAVHRRVAGPARAGRSSRDLRLRPAQPVAVQLRPRDSRPADRRRRPEHAGGDRLRPRGAGLRQQLRLVRLRGDRAASTRTRRRRTRYPRSSPTAATRAARSPAATSSAIARCRRCSAATSTATSAPASCAASSRRPHGPAMTARSV